MQDAGSQDESVMDERDIHLLPPTTIQNLEGSPCGYTQVEPVAMARGASRSTNAILTDRTNSYSHTPAHETSIVMWGMSLFISSVTLTMETRMIFWHRSCCLRLKAEIKASECGLTFHWVGLFKMSDSQDIRKSFVIQQTPISCSIVSEISLSWRFTTRFWPRG